MKRVIYLLALLLSTSLVSCLKLQPLQVKQVESVKILAMTDSTADLAVDLRVDNPNKIKILVKDCNLDAYINHKYVGKVNVRENITIHKKSQDVHTVIVKADMLQVRKIAPSMLFASKALVSLNGNLLVVAKGIKKKIDVNVDQKVSRKEFQNFNLTSNNPVE